MLTKKELIERGYQALAGKKPLSPWVAKRLCELGLAQRTYGKLNNLGKYDVTIGGWGCYNAYVVRLRRHK